ncbi:MAG: lysylphosphatidylglycerol synthase transmembrane domain-containing protein [Dehalococcoidia bacterium]
MLRTRRFWIGTFVSLVFIGLLLWKTNLHQVWDAWRHADPRWIVAAVAVYLISVWLRAFRYRYILLSRVDLSSAQLFPILMIGYMANNVLPVRAGELVRAYVLGERYNVSKMFSLGTIAVERLFDGLALLGLLLATGLLLGVNGVLRGLLFVTAPVFAVALAVFIGVLASPAQSEALARRAISVLPARFRERAQGLVSGFIEGLGALRHPRAFAVVAVTSLLTWSLEGAVYSLVGRALGLHFGLGYYIMATAAANLAITAPSSQGGIGPYEFFAAQTLILAGAGSSVAAAFALATHALVIILATVMGLFFLWRVHLNLGQAVRREEAPLNEAVGSGQ